MRCIYYLCVIHVFTYVLLEILSTTITVQVLPGEGLLKGHPFFRLLRLVFKPFVGIVDGDFASLFTLIHVEVIRALCRWVLVRDPHAVGIMGMTEQSFVKKR